MDIKRQVTYETDEQYLARIFGEAHSELVKVQAAIDCSNFAKSGMIKNCANCKMYAKDNVKHYPEGYGEECLIQLTLNHIAEIRNIAKTGRK